MSMHVSVSGWLLGPASGANHRLLALLRALGPRLATGERITVLHRADYAPPALPGIGWRGVAIPTAPTLARALAERRTLRSALATIGATVHDHGFLPLPRLAVATSLVIHDVRAVDGFGRWPRAIARAVLARACRRADAIVVPSAWTARRIRELVPDAATPTIVPNGVDVATAPSPASPSLPPPASALPRNGYALHVGHLEPRKNLSVVLAALSRLPATTRPQLWLAGRDAGARSGLERRAASLGVADDVRWLGPVPDDELQRLYAHARAVVLPSLHEGFGMPALEALAHGRSVLAADAGALPEVLGAHGVLLPPDDAAAWATALGATTDDDRRADVAKRRRAHARGFAWADSAARLLCLWRHLSPAG